MLNDAQRSSLRIAMSLIEDKMRAMEFRLDHPEEQRLMVEISNNIAPDVARTLREKIKQVFDLIRLLRDRLALPREVKEAGRELFGGLSQLWVVLQESDSKGLQRFGEVDPALAAALDPCLESLGHLILEMEQIAFGDSMAALHQTGRQRRVP